MNEERSIIQYFMLADAAYQRQDWPDQEYYEDRAWFLLGLWFDLD